MIGSQKREKISTVSLLPGNYNGSLQNLFYSQLHSSSSRHLHDESSVQDERQRRMNIYISNNGTATFDGTFSAAELF